MSHRKRSLCKNDPMTKTTTVVPGWLRGILAFVLIFVAVVLTPNAVVASWLKAQVTDTTQFVEMTRSAIQNPDVEDFISAKVSGLIIQELDIDGLTSDLFSGLESALPLGDKAKSALTLLEQPLANGAKSLIVNVTDRVISSDAFDDVTTQVLTVTHEQIMALLRGDTAGALVANETGELGIQVGPIVEAVKKQLVSQGIDLANRIPEINAVIPIGQVDGLVQARIALGALDAAGYWLPIIVLVLLILGVLSARQRARATVWAGIGIVVATGATISGLSIGRYAFLATVSPDTLPGPAANVIFTALTERLNQLLIATLIIGALIAITAYLVGPFRGAQVIRAAVTDTAGRVRAIGEEKGLSTGSFGSFVDKAHSWIVGVILGVTALVLFLMRPFSVSGALWAAIIALVLVLIVEFVRRPDDTAAKLDVANESSEDAPAPSKKKKASTKA